MYVLYLDVVLLHLLLVLAYKIRELLSFCSGW